MGNLLTKDLFTIFRKNASSYKLSSARIHVLKMRKISRFAFRNCAEGKIRQWKNWSV